MTETAGNTTIIYITTDTSCSTNLPPLPKEQDPRWLNDVAKKLSELHKRQEEEWERGQREREEWLRIGEKLETARFSCEIFHIPPKKLGRGREPKKWDHHRPQRTTKVRQKRPRRRR